MLLWSFMYKCLTAYFQLFGSVYLGVEWNGSSGNSLFDFWGNIKVFSLAVMFLKIILCISLYLCLTYHASSVNVLIITTHCVPKYYWSRPSNIRVDNKEMSECGLIRNLNRPLWMQVVDASEGQDVAWEQQEHVHLEPWTRWDASLHADITSGAHAAVSHSPAAALWLSCLSSPLGWVLMGTASRFFSYCQLHSRFLTSVWWVNEWMDLNGETDNSCMILGKILNL